MLREDERVVAWERPSYLALMPHVLTSTVIVGLFALYGYSTIVFLILAAHPAYKLFENYCHARFAVILVTDQRVIHAKTWPQQHTMSSTYDQLVGVKTHHGPFEQLVGLGRVHVESSNEHGLHDAEAHHHHFKEHGVPRAAQLARVIAHRIPTSGTVQTAPVGKGSSGTLAA